MKKIFTIMSLMAATTLLHAQGWISFTDTSAAIKTNSSSYYNQSGTGANVPTLSQGGIYYYALLYSTTPLTGATNTAWIQPTYYVAGVDTANFVIATNGTLTAGGEQGPATGQFQLSMASGTTYDVAVAAWSASLGTSWTEVQAELGNGTQGGASWQANGFFGFINGGTITPALSSPGSSIFPTVFTNGSLQLYAVSVPEPTTIALASLGGLSLLAFRRRNKA
jgi:hypothetical protein